MCRKTKLAKREGVNLLLITNGENRDYTAFKSLTRLLEVVIVSINVDSIFA